MVKAKPDKSVTTTIVRGYRFKVRPAEHFIRENGKGQMVSVTGKPAIWSEIKYLQPYDPEAEVENDPILKAAGVTAEELRKKVEELARIGGSTVVWPWKDRPVPAEVKDLELENERLKKSEESLKAQLDEMRKQIKR